MIQRQGSWLSAGETKLGQGREGARMFLRENPKLMRQLEEQIRQRAANEPLPDKAKKPDEVEALSQRS